jgi:hypothetical protein
MAPSSPNVACGMTRSLTVSVSAAGLIGPTGSFVLAVDLMTGFSVVPDAQGTVNGKALARTALSPALTFLAARGTESDWLLPGGRNTLEVWAPTQPRQTVGFVAPGAFALTLPQAGTATAPLTVAWTPSANAVTYEVTLSRVATPDGGLTRTTSDTTTTFDGVPAGTGPVLVTVKAQTLDLSQPLASPIVNIGREIQLTLQ